MVPGRLRALAFLERVLVELLRHHQQQTGRPVPKGFQQHREPAQVFGRHRRAALGPAAPAQNGPERRHECKRVAGLVAVDSLAGLDRRHQLEQHPNDLLGKHVVVPLHGGALEVRREELGESGARQESVAAAGLAALLDAVGGDHRREGLEGRGGRVHVRDLFLEDGPVGEDLVLHGLEFVGQFAAREKGAVRKCQEREDPVLLLRIIQNLELLPAVLRESLLADRGIPDRDGACHGEALRGSGNNLGPDLHHGDVGNLGGGLRDGFLLVVSVLVDGGKAHGHVAPGDHHVAKLGEPVVHVVVPDLGSDVTGFDSREECVVLHGSERHQKVVDPVAFSLAIDQLGNHHGVIGGFPQRPRPKFAAGEGGAIDDPGSSFLSSLGFGEKGGGGFQRANVGPVPQLGLGVAADHFPVSTEWQPAGLLLLVAEADDVGHKHDPVQRQRNIIGHRFQNRLKVPALGDAPVAFVPDSQLAADLDQPHTLGHAPLVLLGPVEVVVVLVRKDPRRVVRNHFLQVAAALRLGPAPVQDVRDFFHVKGGVGAFALQVRIHYCVLLVVVGFTNRS
mmetsp:Transcript_9048/g.22013  ORF Transcript_9048/g.22013 Transcript_9048/m.22013 type:complete len:563 (+) Transcript_9048:3-1691(+)